MSLIARFMDQHGTHLAPTGPRWAPCWPLEFCYLGSITTKFTRIITQCQCFKLAIFPVYINSHYLGQIETRYDTQGSHIKIIFTLTEMPFLLFCYVTMRETLKKKYRHFDKIVNVGCTWSRQNENFQCSQWWKFRHNGDSSIAIEDQVVIMISLHLQCTLYASFVVLDMRFNP